MAFVALLGVLGHGGGAEVRVALVSVLGLGQRGAVVGALAQAVALVVVMAVAQRQPVAQRQRGAQMAVVVVLGLCGKA